MRINTKKTKLQHTKWAYYSLFFSIFMILMLSGGQKVWAAFTEPTGQPPQENLPGYLDVGGENQAKSGKLRLGNSDNTNINYQLEVTGEGAKIDNTVIDTDLTVDGGTLYVDSQNNRVGIGTLSPSDKLTVQGNVSIDAVGLGIGLSAWSESTDQHALYGTTADTSYAGVAGVGTTASNYGVYGYNFSGIAVLGENTSNEISAVYGSATDGRAVYGDNTNPYGLWAGYFTGRLETNQDVSGAKFLSTDLRSSIIPFTSGQITSEYNYIDPAPYDGAPAVKYFDGTYLWGFRGPYVHKVRASDGFRISTLDVGNFPTGLTYDGQDIWVTVGGESPSLVLKIDSYSGSVLCNYSTLTNARGLVFDGSNYWVLDRISADESRVVKLDGSCSYRDEISLAADTGVDVLDGKIIFNGSYLWIIGKDTANNGIVFNINPSNGKAVAWSDLVGLDPRNIFYDNYYYWTTNYGDGTLTKFVLTDRVCTAPGEFDPDNIQYCSTDSDCDSAPGSGDGACFALPVNYKTYNLGDGSQPRELAFDGTYLWVGTQLGTFRLLTADPAVGASFDTLDFQASGLVFDGTYLWASTGAVLKKVFSGTGYGLTDLGGTLTLQNNDPLILQTGDINVDGSAQVGEDVKSDELNVSENVWGPEESDGSDVHENGGDSLDQGTYDCPDGHFVKNIETNASGEVTRIECRPL